jgi:N-methylhydantoinase A
MDGARHDGAAPLYTLAVDTGGTFTDVVLADERHVLGLYKALTTPQHLFEGIYEALTAAARGQELDIGDLLARAGTFVYSTTHSTNAILKGTTARTAFITTRGNREVLLYKEGGKDQTHNWAVPFPKPYVPRRLTFEITERILSDGTIAIEINDDEVRGVLERLANLEVEAVGVCLLWSFVNSAHELRVGELIEKVLPSVEYSLSHRVNPIIREYRRASATVIDASLKPLMRRHLTEIRRRLGELGFRGQPLMVTHVSGGVMHLDQIIERPLQTVDSGPALAPIAGAVFDETEPAVSKSTVLVVDAGGTSFDVSLVGGGRVALTREKWLGPRWYGYMTGLPAVDTRSIGAGGGSIATVDAGGLLHVGPDSAESDPGPAAYGRGGTEPTVTDAALIVGYINPENFLGGRMALDANAARLAITRRLAGPLGLSVEACAEAVLVVASEEMRGLIMDATVAQGRDARECLMVAGGGAAGLTIVRIAREIGLRELVIPKLAAGLSALGGVYSDITAIFSRGRYTLSSQFDYEGVNEALRDIDADIDRFLSGIPLWGDSHRRFECEARYDRQMWEIEVDLDGRNCFSRPADVADLRERFDEKHLSLFGMNQPGAPIEIMTWRGEARMVRPKPALTWSPGSERSAGERAEPSAIRQVYFDGQVIETLVYRGEDLWPGAHVGGPAIIEEPTTTIVLIPGSSGLVRPSHYLIEIESGDAQYLQPDVDEPPH